MDSVTTRDGAKLACWRSGQGPPLLLVHGSISDRTVWDPIRPALEKRFTVHAMNRRGREGSSPLLEGSLPREFEDVAAMVDSIGEPIHVLGHSFGALCALGASVHTDRIRSLMLFEPPPPAPELRAVAKGLQERIDAGRVEEALLAFLAGGPGTTPEIIERLKGSALWSTMVSLIPTTPRELEAMASYDLEASRFGTVEVPVLLLLGSESPERFRSLGGSLAEVLPDGRIAELRGQEHFANVLAPETFVSEVEKFLDGLG